MRSRWDAPHAERRGGGGVMQAEATGAAKCAASRMPIQNLAAPRCQPLASHVARTRSSAPVAA
eukprot:11055153-Heterocapsa_arctica.AAC.1